MDLPAAAKMRATATVTLFVTFFIAVGCSSAEVNGTTAPIEVTKINFGANESNIKAEIQRQLRKEHKATSEQLGQLFRHKLFAAEPAEKFKAAAAAAAAAEKFKKIELLKIKVTASGVIKCELDKNNRIGKQVVIIGRVIVDKPGNKPGNKHIEHKPGNIEPGNVEDVRIIMSRNYDLIDKLVAIIGKVVDNTTISVTDVVTPAIRCDHCDPDRYKQEMRVEFEEAMLGQVEGNDDAVKELVHAIVETLHVTHDDERLEAFPGVQLGSSWIPAGFFSLTVFLAAAVAVISWNLQKKTKTGFRKASFSKKMK